MPLDTTIGGASADSYATLAEYQARAAAFGWTLAGDPADEINLRKAAVALDSGYNWLGYADTETQALAWPREISQSVGGYYVQSDAIPANIKTAQMELAYLIQGGADPFATLSGGMVKRKREKVDVIEEETEYMDGGARERAAYPLIDALVGPFAHGKVGARGGSLSLARA